VIISTEALYTVQSLQNHHPHIRLRPFSFHSTQSRSTTKSVLLKPYYQRRLASISPLPAANSTHATYPTTAHCRPFRRSAKSCTIEDRAALGRSSRQAQRHPRRRRNRGRKRPAAHQQVEAQAYRGWGPSISLWRWRRHLCFSPTAESEPPMSPKKKSIMPGASGVAASGTGSGTGPGKKRGRPPEGLPPVVVASA